MNKAKLIAFIVILLLFIGAYAESADESVLFTNVPPNALVLLDLSGSMQWTAVGETMYTSSSSTCGDNVAYYDMFGTGHTKSCTIDPYGTVPQYSNSTCSGPFYRNTNNPGYTTDCSRLAIAKRAIFNLLDDTHDGIIRSTGSNTDDSNLNVNMGYMRFSGCSHEDADTDWTSGCVTLVNGFGSRYSKIYCNDNNSCTLSSSNSSSVSGEDASGGTPLANALDTAKAYMDNYKNKDSAAACRDNFVILITDGADTYACEGTGSENQSDQYKRRRATVAKAKALRDAGYKVFVIGFGSNMPAIQQNTLNWAAYLGGTDNPLVGNSGDTTAITATSNPCNSNTSNDPGNAALTGYAFFAQSPADLAAALDQAMSIIRSANYSFSISSVSTARITSENNLYEASFNPIDDDPFWQGHLKKYNIDGDGNIGSVIWDAGTQLESMTAATRNMKTYIGGSVINFDYSIDPAYFGLAGSDTAGRNAIVGYLRGETAYNQDFWKLGDIFHSNPVVITSPSPYFDDKRDSSGAYADYRTSHQRTSANGQRVIVTGANDGQFHVFRTDNGNEVFSFVPPNLLSKLSLISHSTHPTALSHQYYLDGPISASDVWLGTGDGKAKNSADWKTIVVFGQGRGVELGSGINYLWSSSQYCDSGFSGTYSSTYQYYCGYYAFDFSNDTNNPVYKWRINPSISDAPYLAEPWSSMALGRVIVGGNEKWVGFIGGGGYSYSCSGPIPKTATTGKAFFVVDLNNGDVLWSYHTSSNGNDRMTLAASPYIADTDNDGFIDTAYVGDLDGNMWRFKFCTRSQGPTCNISSWSGSLLFDSSGNAGLRPVYSGTSVASDTSGNLWVYWGSGDKQCPADPNAADKLYAVKDNDRSSTYKIGDLQNVTGSSYTITSKDGWYVNLTGQGEKMLSQPLVFGGVIYFTTFTPSSGNNLCQQGGTAKLYGFSYTSGANNLNMNLGTGIPSAPIISLNPNASSSHLANLYITLSGGSGVDSKTYRVNIEPPFTKNRARLLYWKDKKIQ